MEHHTNPMQDGGYDREDEYFKKQELELLAKRRAKLDAERQEAASDHSNNPHWMKCPKCGGDLQEVALDPVMVDKCGSCGGIYFDAGELEMLTKSLHGGGFFKKLFN